jgi:hypothetical protein
MARPEAEALRRSLLAAAGRAGRARASARLRLSWSAGQDWSAALAACPDALAACSAPRRADGPPPEGAMEARLSEIDALLPLAGRVAWIGSDSRGLLPLGALPPPPDRLIGAWRTRAPGEAVLALPSDLSWHARLCALEGLRRRWP